MIEQVKKPLNVGALSMVFLSLSTIFCILSYGFGQINQYKWDVNNIDSIGESLGYNMEKGSLIVINDNFIMANTSNSNSTITICNTSRGTCIV